MTRLAIHDERFLTNSLIERCPKDMMVRELTVNAVESAVLCGKPTVVEIRGVRVEGVRKLCFFNEGPGMDADELLAISGIAYSGKTLGLDKNFGMGAKVAALASNKTGLRYRSCKDGVVSQMILGHDGDDYCVFQQVLPDGSEAPVTDVTVSVILEGLPLDRDWTDVTLCGNAHEQDTVSDPYGDSKAETQWIGTALVQRFDSLPDGIQIRLGKGTTRGDKSGRTFKSFAEKVAEHGQVSEELDQSSGIRVRYLYNHLMMKSDGQGHYGSVHGSLTTKRVGGGIVHRGEFYDVHDGAQWSNAAPSYGITFGSKQLYVNVLLPDDYGVRPEQYRCGLDYVGDDQVGALTEEPRDTIRVRLQDFRHLVVSLMPDWFAEKVREFRPDRANDGEDIQNWLQEWMNSRRNHRPTAAPAGEGTLGEDADAPLARIRAVKIPTGVDAKGNGRGGQGRRDPPPASNVRFAPAGAVAAKMRVDSGSAPRIERVYDEAAVAENNLKGMAGRYDSTPNVLLVNMRYSAFEEARLNFALEYASSPADPETRDQLVLKHSRDLVLQAIGMAVARALVKHGLDEWALETVHQATTSPALSVAADGWDRDAAAAKQRLSRLIKKTAAGRGREDIVVEGEVSAGVLARADGQGMSAHQA